jgi:hypothetical protein
MVWHPKDCQRSVKRTTRARHPIRNNGPRVSPRWRTRRRSARGGRLFDEILAVFPGGQEISLGRLEFEPFRREAAGRAKAAIKVG